MTVPPIDLSINEKQLLLADTVLSELWIHEDRKINPQNYPVNEATGQIDTSNDIREFYIGGAISGGKTIGVLSMGVLLCAMYPKSKWIVIRASYNNLEQSSIPSLKKIVGDAGVWGREGYVRYWEASSGARIYFRSENADQDKDLDWLKGLEPNGFILEQMEELQEETLKICRTRLGRHHIEKEPPGFIFGTFNPTWNWVKTTIWDPYAKGVHIPNTLVIPALPNDNPTNTPEQWAAWKRGDTKTYARFIEGNWEIDIEGQFAYAFKDKNKTRGLKLNPDYDIVLCFDFNVDPMTCVVCQTDYRSFYRAVKEFRMPNSDTYALCEEIKPFVAGREHTIVVTGDASGQNRMSGTRGHINQYHIIREQFGIHWDQFQVPTVNPLIVDRRVLLNSILEKLPECVVDELQCPFLVEDLRFTLTYMNPQGEIGIKKTGKNKFASKDNSEIGHLLDCFSYGLVACFTDWFQMYKS